MIPTIYSRDISSQSVKNAADKIIESVTEGEADPIDIYSKIKWYEEVIKRVKEGIRDATIIELEKHGRGIVREGNKLVVNNGKRIFKYDHSERWRDMAYHIKQLEEKMKAAINMTVFDEDTGEEIDPAKVTYTTESISVTLK
jgi:endo-alpha-1,4-polygalactosaminidase (GH114 family)